jgi:hypothetical protein
VNVLVIDGSRRPKSNTGAIARDLAARLTAAGQSTQVWRVPKWSAGPQATDEALEKLVGAEVVVLVAPSYLDELPAVTQRLLEDVWERRAELHGHAPLFYGIAHSGFPEPVQRRAELRSMRFFAEQMGWAWMGGVGFGGTSPIDGRPLEQAGMFSRQLRKVLPLVVADIAAGRPFSPETVRRSEKSPFPLPRKALIALVNSRTRKAACEMQLDLEARVYAARDRA